MILFLFAVMFILSCLQKTPDDKIVALCYTLSVIFINLFVIFPENYAFLFSALYEGTGVCFMLSSLQYKDTGLKFKLQCMCFVLIALQAGFYATWYAEIDELFGVKIEQIYEVTWAAYYQVICVFLFFGAGLRGFVAKHFRVCGAWFGLRQYHNRIF